MAQQTQGSVRQRKGQASKKEEKPGVTVVEEVNTSDESEAELLSSSSSPKPKPTPKGRVNDEDGYSPWLDVLRVLSFLALASCGLSYLISGGESFTWGVRQYPKYMQVDWWKEQLKGPLYLTPAELAQYDGTDEAKPLYLAINGTIYDVSSNRRIYGPSGSYRYFAGADASRSYVTGCFAEDRTADLRGAEDMYLPLDDPAVDEVHWTAAELAELKAREREDALRRVDEGLAHWVNFFKNNPKYPRVGYVKRDRDWLEREPRRTLCEAAAKGRKTRKVPGKKES
ncbi:cytochrome b5 [Xylariomycetidae sp. FL2044]|nr:cytochrome b5 [Xylariomycetidae sp. FL2044]